MDHPEYLVANPVNNCFYEVPFRQSYEPMLNLFYEITYVKTIVPIKTYRKIKDITNPKEYGFVIK